jgi:hypothetical protein
MSVQGSSLQSKAEVQADKNWLLQTCLSILEIFWYLWYPGDPPRDAESLGRSLYLWGAVSEVHVISRDVNSKYGIVKNQLQDPDGMTRYEERFLKNLTTHPQWRGGEDYAEFFDGAPPLDVIHHITRSHLMTAS